MADDVDRDREFLAEQGIFLEAVGVGDDCVFVSLANPTAPNVAYMRRRYARACVEPRPMGPVLRVVTQCPRAGERVRAGTEIALQAETVLPGGFRYFVGTAGSCDDRHAP